MTFGTINDSLTFECNVGGCQWEDSVVHDDWMFYGAGIGNPEAMNPMMCAQRCALDINCGAFEYDTDSRTKTNYCSWWKVGICDKGQAPINSDGAFEYPFQTCAKVPCK